MKRNPLSIIVLIILFIGSLVPGFSQDRKAELRKLSRDSDVILTGKVQKRNSYWNKNKDRIFTNVTIEVEEYVKGGGRNKSIIVTHPGGEVGEVGEWYSHTPGFEDDEEVLLFLRMDPNDGSYKVVFGEDGKMSLHIDRNTGEKVTPAHVGISVLKQEIKSVLK